ncbi:MAG: MFS transporter [Caulobacteraceae bacterium]
MHDHASAPDRRPEPLQAFTPRQVSAAIGLGVISLMMSGLMPIFVGALASEHRLSAAGIGRVATLELLCTALTTGIAGAALKLRRLKVVGVLAALALAGANLVTVGAAGVPLMAARALAGVPEGLLLWMVIGLIARSPTPERRAGLLFTAMAASQLLVAVILALAVLPRFGVDGGYLFIAGLSLLGMPIALLLPSAHGPLPEGTEGGMPPPRGWIALFAVFVFQASVAGASVYIVPLALQAGFSPRVAHTAIAMALALEVAGGAFATAISGRANFLDVLLVSALVMLGAFGVYVARPADWAFVTASAAIGFCALLIMPFIVPMTIKADPSRRTAVQIGGAQLMGGAVGPVLSSMVVTARNAHGAVYLSAALLVTSLCAIYGLNRQTRSNEI